MEIDKKQLIYNLKKLVNFSENHWEVLKRISCLKEAFAYSKVYRIPQTYGALLQKKIIQLYNWKVVEATELKGDIKTKKKFIELKISLGGKSNKKFNFVQLRLSHKIDFYIFIAYVINQENYSTLGELFIFKISKNDILSFLNKCFSHGTKEKWAKVNNYVVFHHAEKDLRVRYGSKLWMRLLDYRINLQDLKDL